MFIGIFLEFDCSRIVKRSNSRRNRILLCSIFDWCLPDLFHEVKSKPQEILDRIIRKEKIWVTILEIKCIDSIKRRGCSWKEIAAKQINWVKFIVIIFNFYLISTIIYNLLFSNKHSDRMNNEDIPLTDDFYRNPL